MEDRDMKCYKKDYPRPQFVRDNWVNLNGTWDLSLIHISEPTRQSRL